MFENLVISRRQIALKIASGLHLRFWSCNFSTTKIASSCRDKNRLCKRALINSVCRWRHQSLKSKTKGPLKVSSSSGISGTITIICLQLSRSIASFIWKPALAHFEYRSYGGAWHKAKIAFVEKYALISWCLAILGIRKIACVNVFWFGSDNQSTR